MVVSQQDKLKEYHKVGIGTSNQKFLILKCYDGVLGCLKTSKILMSDRKRWPEVSQHMVKAQKGLALLADAVNVQAGEVGKNLLALYDFMIRYLVNANLKKDAAMIDEVIIMLTDLRESWEKAFEKLQQGDAATVALPRPASRQNVVNIVG
jgi:flagellar protein FliS